MSRVMIRSCDALQHVLAVDQKIRDHAGHGPAMVEDRLRQRPHQADRTAAIDQPDAGSRPGCGRSCGAASTNAGLVPGPEAQ